MILTEGSEVTGRLGTSSASEQEARRYLGNRETREHRAEREKPLLSTLMDKWTLKVARGGLKSVDTPRDAQSIA